MASKLRKTIAYYFLPRESFWKQWGQVPGRVVETIGEFSRFKNDVTGHNRILDALSSASGPVLLKIQPHEVISRAQKTLSVESVKILEVIDTSSVFIKFKHLCLSNAMKFVQGLYFQEKGKLALAKQRLLNLAHGNSGFQNPIEEIRHISSVTAEIVASSLAMDVVQGLPPETVPQEKAEHWNRAFALAYEAISQAQLVFLVRMIARYVQGKDPVHENPLED